MLVKSCMRTAGKLLDEQGHYYSRQAFRMFRRRGHDVRVRRGARVRGANARYGPGLGAKSHLNHGARAALAEQRGLFPCGVALVGDGDGERPGQHLDSSIDQ